LTLIGLRECQTNTKPWKHNNIIIILCYMIFRRVNSFLRSIWVWVARTTHKVRAGTKGTNTTKTRFMHCTELEQGLLIHNFVISGNKRIIMHNTLHVLSAVIAANNNKLGVQWTTKLLPFSTERWNWRRDCSKKACEALNPLLKVCSIFCFFTVRSQLESSVGVWSS